MLCSWANFYLFLRVSLISCKFFAVESVAIFPPQDSVQISKASSPKSIIWPTVAFAPENLLMPYFKTPGTVRVGTLWMRTQHICKFWSLFHTILWSKKPFGRYILSWLWICRLKRFFPLSIADSYFRHSLFTDIMGTKYNGDPRKKVTILPRFLTRMIETNNYKL